MDKHYKTIYGPVINICTVMVNNPAQLVTWTSLQWRTRMHSSRMRTARSLTASRSIRRGRRRACRVMCVPRLGHVCPGWVQPGVGAGLGACMPKGYVCHTCPPGTEFLTHACENIIFPQLPLRAVKITYLRCCINIYVWNVLIHRLIEIFNQL